jgi:hypothetical protein
MRKVILLLVALLPIGACSLLNKEGPDVTCRDLGDGTMNDCEDDIIASCVGGKLYYDVCTGNDECKQVDAGWYKCVDAGK